MDAFFRAANVILFLVNIALAALWLSLVRVDSLPKGGDQAAFVLSQVSTQVSILGVTVAFSALVLGALGFFGFQTVSERAANKAEEVARQLVNSRLDDMMRSGGTISINRTPKGPLPEVKDATEANDKA